jgi:hypothetical protein
VKQAQKITNTHSVFYYYYSTERERLLQAVNPIASFFSLGVGGGLTLSTRQGILPIDYPDCGLKPHTDYKHFVDKKAV